LGFLFVGFYLCLRRQPNVNSLDVKFRRVAIGVPMCYGVAMKFNPNPPQSTDYALESDGYGFMYLTACHSRTGQRVRILLTDTDMVQLGALQYDPDIIRKFVDDYIDKTFGIQPEGKQIS
jgi:hypothetical protein